MQLIGLLEFVGFIEFVESIELMSDGVQGTTGK
jgi:hypothetical protein